MLSLQVHAMHQCERMIVHFYALRADGSPIRTLAALSRGKKLKDLGHTMIELARQIAKERSTTVHREGARTFKQPRFYLFCQLSINVSQLLLIA